MSTFYPQKKIGHLRLVKSEPAIKKDWSIPYSDVKEVGRGILQNDGKLTNIIIRYFSYEKLRFEKQRYFAEVNICKDEKFIVDGTDLDMLVQYVTDSAWSIIQCRIKFKIINSKNLKLLNINSFPN